MVNSRPAPAVTVMDDTDLDTPSPFRYDPLALLIEVLTAKVYPENRPGVVQVTYTAEELAEAGFNVELVLLWASRLK